MMNKSELIQAISDVFHSGIPFNRFLGIEVRVASADHVELFLPMKAELIGNPHHQILHGGVTASLLDVTGGLAALIAGVDRWEQREPEFVRRRMARIGTIDLRVDFLRPARGNAFTATARVIRHGHKVAVVRMEMFNASGQEVALGTATYVIG